MKNKLIYLDNAATTYPKPREVLDAMVSAYLQIGVSPGRGSYDLSTAADDFVQKTRIKVAHFFSAPDPNRVVFTANATDGLNLALLGWLQPGDHVVTTCLEHNSVLRPLYYLQKQQNITCTLISFNQDGYIDPEDIARAIRPATRLVIVNHASNVLGTIQPVGEVGQICRDRGVAFLVDTSQSAGQIPVDMHAMKASALVFSGHKSLYAPPGIGALIVHPDLDLQSTRFGGTGIASKNLDQPRDFPFRLEAGTHNLLGIIGLSLALDYLQKKGLEKIHKQEMALFMKLCSGLSQIRGVKLYGALNSDQHLAVLTLNIENVAPENAAAILDADFDIAVRSGLHCAPLVHEKIGTGHTGAVRFSLGLFNTEAQILRTIDAVHQIAGKHR